MQHFCEFVFRAGITFAAVHDSYWTHAGTVDVMNKVHSSLSFLTFWWSRFVCFVRLFVDALFVVLFCCGAFLGLTGFHFCLLSPVQIIRQQFVELHSQPIVDELGLSFQERYGKPE